MNAVTLPKDITLLTDDALLELTNNALKFTKQDRQEWQLLYYQPNSPKSAQIHHSTAHLIGVGGGNRSGKTDSSLAEAAIQMTGIIPDSLRDTYPREKLRGPISVRVVCESLTTTMHPVILRKLNYREWSGTDMAGGERGHWGWIPKSCLLNEDWDRSWKESKRTLTVLCRNPDNPEQILGYSTLQIMSSDQDTDSFKSGEFHLVIMDEPPSYSIFRENRARVMSVGGRLMIDMTWPDDPTIPVDWIFDEVYDVGQPGPKKLPDVEWIELNTMDNPNIDLTSVRREAAAMSDIERAVRIGGQPIRFSNMIHPLFTAVDRWWCFGCNQEVLCDGDACSTCSSTDTASYNHVQDFAIESNFPAVFLLDPHPRKPHMMCWVTVDGNDDYSMVKCLEVDNEPDEVKKQVEKVERELHLRVARRLGDPNMLRSPASSRRNVTWQDEFDAAGLYMELADDGDVGRGRVNEYLKPDPHTHRPRLRFHEANCTPAIYQMTRFCWDDFRFQDNKDQKQKPRPKYDDYPALLRYLLNAMPLCQVLRTGGTVIQPRGTRKHGY